MSLVNRTRPVSTISLVSGQNRISSLLTPEETDLVFGLLGYGCQSLGTAVIQLFSTKNDVLKNVWHQKHFGVLCLVRDKMNRSFFFRLYCLTTQRLIWQHELYIGMEYMTPQNFLHIFEAEDCMVAFNFASEEEAWDLKTAVLERLKKINRKHDENSTIDLNNVVDKRKKKKRSGHKINLAKQNVSIENKTIKTKELDFKKKGPLKRVGGLSKADISNPTDFIHFSGFGRQRCEDSDVENDSILTKGVNYNLENLKAYLDKEGMSEEMSSELLKDPDTCDFIYAFLSTQLGGLDVVKKLQPSPLPSKKLSSPVTNTHTITTAQNVPPPPPPPPLINIPPPPPLASRLDITPPPTQADPRSDLMRSITMGSQLKPVDHNSIKPTPPSDSRGELLEKIRQGVALNPVDPKVLEKPKENFSGIVGALLEALNARKQGFGDSSSDESNNSDVDDEDDDWDA
ncbi:hypothetical protein WDU94_001335 [Cyamophila willieti]